MTSPPDVTAIPKHRWYTPTPAKFLLGVLLMQGVLFLSSRFHWFWFNEHKGYTVLIAVAATAILLILLPLSSLVGRVFGGKSQLGLSTLLLTMLVMAVPLGWLGAEIQLARQQRAVVANLEKRGEYVSYEQGMTSLSYISFRLIPVSKQPLRPALHQYLERVMGRDFFQDACFVSAVRANDETLAIMRDLPQLSAIQILNATVTEDGLRHLHGLEQLRSLLIQQTTVTKQSITSLQEALPQCEIVIEP